MVERIVFQRGKLPPLDSDQMKRFAKHLWDYALYLMDCRKEREIYVRECDLIYDCQRFIPDLGAIELIEDGEFGETDIFDITNAISIRVALSLMDRQKRWLAAASREDDTERAIQAIEDWNIWSHHKSKTRRMMQRVIKQGYVRGRTGFYWDWIEDVRFARLDRASNPLAVERFLAKSGLPLSEAKNFTRGRFEIVDRAGPVITPIDWYDQWSDPVTDLITQRRPNMMIRRFFPTDRLKMIEDDDGEKVYNVPDSWNGYRLEDIWGNDEHAGSRHGSPRMWGRNTTVLPPQAGDSGIRITPVYILYFQEYKFEGEKFWDTYFYLAKNPDGETVRLIKVEENPDDLGHSRIILEDYIDPYTPVNSGGLSGIEKLSGKYHQKNLLQLLMITGAAHSIVPAQLALSGIWRDDEDVSWAPGALNLLDDSAVGQRSIRDVIGPVPTWERGVVLGEQTLRFIADELRASSGIEGLSSDTPSRTLSQPKTATEINRDATSGGFVLENLTENWADMLTNFCQAVFETAQSRLTGNETGVIEYERYLGNRMMMAELKLQDFQKKRSIAVLGARADLNKQEDLANHLQAMQVTAQVADPRMQAFRTVLAVRILEKLNIEVPEALKVSDAQMVAEIPEVQIAAIDQLANNPNVIEMFQQGGMLNGQSAGGSANPASLRPAG